MASTTSNIGLTKPAGTDKALVSVINSNSDIIDSAAGGLMDAIAIVANGNTHAAISAGQYVYVHNHGTLAEGLYTANSAIAANATLSTSNLTADASGGLNALNSNVSVCLPKSNINIATFCGRVNELPANSTFLFSMNSANSVTLVGKTGTGYGEAKIVDGGVIYFTYFQPAQGRVTHGAINSSTQAVTRYSQSEGAIHYECANGSTLQITNLPSAYLLTTTPSAGAQCKVYVGTGYGATMARHKLSLIVGDENVTNYTATVDGTVYALNITNNTGNNLHLYVTPLN